MPSSLSALLASTSARPGVRLRLSSPERKARLAAEAAEAAQAADADRLAVVRQRRAARAELAALRSLSPLQRHAMASALIEPTDLPGVPVFDDVVDSVGAALGIVSIAERYDESDLLTFGQTARALVDFDSRLVVDHQCAHPDDVRTADELARDVTYVPWRPGSVVAWDGELTLTPADVWLDVARDDWTLSERQALGQRPDHGAVRMVDMGMRDGPDSAVTDSAGRRSFTWRSANGWQADRPVTVSRDGVTWTTHRRSDGAWRTDEEQARHERAAADRAAARREATRLRVAAHRARITATAGAGGDVAVHVVASSAPTDGRLDDN